jgi:RNA polymerase II-associated factor 1
VPALTVREGPPFLCKVKYASALPPLPFDPKFLKCPLEEDRYVKFKETTMERNYKWELFPDTDVGVSLDLIDLRAYAVPDQVPKLEPVDARLCASV